MTHISLARVARITANIIDEAGNAGPGGIAWYTAIVIDSVTNLPVPQPNTGTPGNMYADTSVAVTSGDTLASIATAVQADVQRLWGDSTLNVKVI